MNQELTPLVSHGHTGDAVTAAADLGRRDAERVPEPYDLDTTSAVVVARVRNDERLETLHLERHLDAPLIPRGTATLHDPADFASYVTRLGDEHRTTLWADLQAGSIVAVLDDHADHESAGWRQHTVHLCMQDDADWRTWLELNGKLRSQTVFADHIESMTHTIVSPSAAEMLEVVEGFHAKKNVTFRQQVNRTSNDIQLAYEEETKSSTKAGHMEVPRVFTIRISPWLTVAPVELTARLRYSIDGGQLAIGYALLRPDLAKRTAFDTVIETVKELPFPLHLGTPPYAVKPRT